MNSADAEVLGRHHRRLLSELRDLERQSRVEGGFRADDPRQSRWLDVGREADDLEADVLLASLGFETKRSA